MSLINTNNLLLNINSENPSGCCIEYDPVYHEISQAKESDPEYLLEGKWSVNEPRYADWSKVKKLCEQVLCHQSKDLQVGCWYVESLYQLYGTEGLSCGLSFLYELIQRFWSTMWPSLEDGTELRYSKLIKLDKSIYEILLEYPVLKRKNVTLSYWNRALSFEHSLSVNPEKNLTADSDGPEVLSMEAFRRKAGNILHEDIHHKLKSLSVIFQKLEEVESSYFFYSTDSMHHIFSKTKRGIHDLKELLKSFLPAETYESPSGVTSSVFFPGDDDEPDMHPRTVTDGTDMTRERAIELMMTIAAFFRSTEPSSPVPYLIERAVRWADMSLAEWLEELVEDKATIKNINNILKGGE